MYLFLVEHVVLCEVHWRPARKLAMARFWQTRLMFKVSHKKIDMYYITFGNSKFDTHQIAFLMRYFKHKQVFPVLFSKKKR